MSNTIDAFIKVMILLPLSIWATNSVARLMQAWGLIDISWLSLAALACVP